MDSYHRDNEKAYVTVNNKECWSKKILGREGSQECGDRKPTSNEDVTAVQCQAEAADGEMKVVVYTELTKGAAEASFAIDNVVITKISASAFDGAFVKCIAKVLIQEKRAHLIAAICLLCIFRHNYDARTSVHWSVLRAHVPICVSIYVERIAKANLSTSICLCVLDDKNLTPWR